MLGDTTPASFPALCLNVVTPTQVAVLQYKAAGKECYVNNTNSWLGLAMYASYFGLFLDFFVRAYCCGKKSKAKATAGGINSAGNKKAD